MTLANAYRPDQPGQAGFSMLELLVVVAVIAIMTAAFAPGFDNFLSTRPSLEAALKQLEGVIIEGRSQPTPNNSYRISVENGVISLSEVAGEINQCDAATVPTLLKSYLSQGVNITDPNNGNSRIIHLCFNNTGEIVPANVGSIVYQITRDPNERAYQLTVWELARSLERRQRANANNPNGWVLMQ